MTLDEWAATEGLTDRQIAERMTDWIREHEDGGADPVSVPAVQKYRTGRPPKGERMRAVCAITGGWVRADDFFGIDDLTPGRVMHGG